MGSTASQVPASLLIDTSIPFPVALDDGGWKKAGVALNPATPPEAIEFINTMLRDQGLTPG